MLLMLPYPPSANRLWIMARGRLIQPKPVRDWKRQVADIAVASGEARRDAQVRAVITLLPKLTKAGRPFLRRLDLDNTIKAAFDALNGVAWADDSQVVALVASVGEPVRGGALLVEVGDFQP